MPRGRPKGSKNKSTLIREGKWCPITDKPILPEDPRPDSELMADMESRFDVFERMMTGMVHGDVTSLIVSGAPGVGKSYTAHQVLSRAQEEDNTFRFTMKSGTVTPVELYKLAYVYRHPKHVIVLDDSDGIMGGEDGLNVLKGLLDSGTKRVVSWLSNSSALKVEGEETPKEFEYKGSIAFLTNKNFQTVIDGEIGRSNVEHMRALMSRSLYLDLKMHTRREVSLWVRNIIEKSDLLVHRGLPRELQNEAIEYLTKHRDDLREMSIRTVIKLGQIMLINPVNWETDARHMLLK